MPPSEGRGDQVLPERIGRFEVIGRLGQGGMGQVLRARDPKLGREVAIKLLHADVDAGRAPLHAEVARQRLLREAQAMARLDHPNVIGVHEVGEEDGRVFLVMDKVSGATMTGWLAAAPRGWREIVRVFEQVGAGVAAAHAAGLVHRDLKPDNVLIGDDGRVRVTDFGLVGVDGTSGPLPAPAAADDVDPMGRTSESLPPALTHEGALVGTPGYMAPEQVRGQPADARSDQFGLSVALYEALFGKAPFAGDTYRARMLAVLDGNITPPPVGTDVPSAITDVVLRGLAHDADARWPDIPALVAALTAAATAPVVPVVEAATPLAPLAPPVSPRRRWPIAAAAVVVLGGGVGAWRVLRGARVERHWPLPATAVEPFAASGACDRVPVLLDERTLVYSHADRGGSDLRVRDLVTGADRALTTTPDVEELTPGPARGERAVIAIPKAFTDAGAGPARIDLDTGAVVPLPGGLGIAFGPGVFTAGGALYYVLEGQHLMELRDGVATERATFLGGIGAITVDPAGHVAAVLAQSICTLDLRTHDEPVCVEGLDGPYGRPALDAAGRIYYAGFAGLRRHDPSTGKDVLLVADRGANGGLAVSAAGDALYFSECQPQIAITAVADGAVIHTESLTRAQRNRPGAWVFVRENPSSSVLAYLDPDRLLHVLTQVADGTPSDPALEPNGERIVFFLSGPKESGYYLAWGQSHRPRRKLSDKAFVGSMWVDDRRVAATLFDADARPHVHLIDLDSGADVQALPAPRLTFDRQPDGGLVLLGSDDRSRLFLWDPGTNVEREVPLPAEVAKRAFLDADLGPGARWVDVQVGPEIWTVPLDPPGPASRVFVPPSRKGFWGWEVDDAGRRYALLSEDKGDLFRLAIPK